MKKRRKMLLPLVCIIAAILTSCGNTANNQSEIVIDESTTKATVHATSAQQEQESYQEETTTITERADVAVTFEDVELRNAVCRELGIDSESAITDAMCESITSLECIAEDNLISYSTVSTLTDLELLPNLETLIINNLGFSLDTKGINKASKLKSVTLINCDLRDIERIGDISTLEYLKLYSDTSDFVNDLSPLSNLTSLKTLILDSVSEGDDTDLSFLSNLTSLEELCFFSGYEYTPLPFESLPNLKKLTMLGDPNVIFSQLNNSGLISSLEYLDIQNTDGIEDDTIRNYVSKCQNAQFLHLDLDSSITSPVTSLSGLGELQNLESLDLNNNNAFEIPCSEYAELSKLSNLKELIIHSSIDSYEFLNGMNSLEYLTISLKDEMSIGSFSELPNLKQLTINSGSGFYTGSGIDISDIGKFSSLEKLYYSSEVKLKSTAPLDDLPQISAEKITHNTYERVLY